MSAPAQAETVYSILDFKELDGWADDDHQVAFDTFRDTCRDMKTLDWQTLYRTANDQKNASAPVWIEEDGKAPLRRLMIAQDTGSTIKGAQRADVFFGTGDQAGKEAGSLRDPGRMVVLMPIQRAYAYLSENVQ